MAQPFHFFAGKIRQLDLLKDVTADNIVCKALLDHEKIRDISRQLRYAVASARLDRLHAIKNKFFSSTLAPEDLKKRYADADGVVYSASISKENFRCQCEAGRGCPLRNQYLEQRVCHLDRIEIALVA